MHVGNQMVSGTTLQTNMAATRTVIVEVKYINSKNVVIHSENCKVEIPVDITAQQLSKKICRMTGTYEASKKRGFIDCSNEMFYVDYIEPGQPRKLHLFLELTISYLCFLKANQNLSHSLLYQPVGICTEFSRNINVADSGSGSIKLINRPLHSIVEFLTNLQTLLTAFHIHAKGKFY